MGALARVAGFRYSGNVVLSKTGRFIALTIAATAAACSRGPRNPEAAYEKLAEATREGDARALFEALDQETRWSWMSVLRCHREAFDIVHSNFPGGDDRESKLARFEPGATAEDAAALFEAAMGEAALARAKNLLPERATISREGPDRAMVTAKDGSRIELRQVEGRWGYTGFSADADARKLRAVADLELTKTSATDYERAAARGRGP